MNPKGSREVLGTRKICRRSGFSADGGEIRHLEWNDVDLKNRLLHVRPKEVWKEEVEKARHSYSFAPRWDYHPTGELSLRIKEYGGDGIRKNCSDTDKFRLEERLTEFLEIVRRFAAHELMERRQREHAARERAAEQARLAELRAQQEAEARRIQELEMEVAAWHKAEGIRAYVQTAQRMGSADEAWVLWATKYADQIDPLSPS